MTAMPSRSCLRYACARITISSCQSGCGVGYIRAFDKVLNLRVKSWDEAFGAPLPKGARLQDRRRHRELGPAVWLEVRQLLNSLSPPAIDEALFEQVGQKFGIKKTLAQEIYYEWQRRNA